MLVIVLVDLLCFEVICVCECCLFVVVGVVIDEC